MVPSSHPSPVCQLPERVQMSITFRTWVSRRFISVTIHDLGQELINFSKTVMWFLVAQFFPGIALAWTRSALTNDHWKHGEGRASSSVCCPGDSPFISAPSRSQGGASYLRTPVPTMFRVGAVTLCCCSSVLSSSSYLLCACGPFPCPH